MRGNDIELSGLTNRWIPLTSGPIGLNGWIQEEVSREKVISNLQTIKAWAGYHNGSTVSTSCDKPNKEDHIQKIVGIVNGREEVKGFELPQERLEGMSKKAIVQAAKAAGIMAICYAAEGDSTAFSEKRELALNCDIYFGALYRCILLFHIGSLGLETTLTANAEIVDKVKNIIKRKGTASKRDIYKIMHMKKYEIDGLLQMLLDGDEIKKVNDPKSKAKDIFALAV